MLVATVDVSKQTDAGDVGVGIGFLKDDNVTTDQKTTYKDFTLWGFN